VSAQPEDIFEITIRRMASSDLDDVLDIEYDSYSMPWGEATFRGLLRRSDAELLVAEAAGMLIGYAACWFVVDQGELGNVAVARGWRHRGIGARLVSAAIARAAKRGVRELFLEVRPSNPTAQRLYERFGFEPVGRRRNYYVAPSEDAIVMRRLIQSRQSGDE
jgi:[ribosomal protein S18]-alanine N-acetyltransferase